MNDTPVRSPYRYLDYYRLEDADLFFGREQEVQKMVGEVLSSRLLVLFSPSGSGKTSLINAGVRPELEKLGYKTIHTRLESNPVTSIQDAVSKELNVDGQPKELHGFLTKIVEDRKIRLVVFVDQFEEFFIVFRESPKLREEFIRQVALVRYDEQLPVFLVLSLREDYFADLHEFREVIPSIFQNNANVRLTSLATQEARRAIEMPVRVVGYDYESDLVDRLIEDLKDGSGRVAPIKLQIVCWTLWREFQRRQPQGGGAITPADYEACGKAKDILEKSVFEPLNSMPRTQKPLMVRILNALKTPDNTKRYRPIEDLRDTLRVSNDQRIRTILTSLAGNGVLRHEERQGTDWYEFKHDYLVGQVAHWIQGWNERRAKHTVQLLSAGLILALVGLPVAFLWKEIRYVGSSLLVRSGVVQVAKPAMVEIPEGTYEQGDDEKHQVRINGFKMGRYEVTFEEYDRYLELAGGQRPGDAGWGRDRRPVIYVSWGEAKDYAKWLSRATGNAYRLPTESEWEYAARGREKNNKWAGASSPQELKDYAVYGTDRTDPVGQKTKNSFELHDMSGNVWEWVEDCWHDDYQGAPTDGSAWLEGGKGDCGRRVLRGGSWVDRPELLRASNRNGVNADFRDGNLGFRLVQDMTE
ncbi:MAG: SUMF1/EgtB/PvdO family nonheme iron enzyme [Nitrospiraceae bacterium]